MQKARKGYQLPPPVSERIQRQTKSPRPLYFGCGRISLTPEHVPPVTNPNVLFTKLFVGPAFTGVVRSGAQMKRTICGNTLAADLAADVRVTTGRESPDVCVCVLGQERSVLFGQTHT